MPKFEVTFSYSVEHTHERIIKAASIEEANNIAQNMIDTQDEFFTFEPGEFAEGNASAMFYKVEEILS